MKVSLNFRPLITDKDERFENGFWEDRGILNSDEAIKNIQEINWVNSAKELKKTVNENEDLTIYKIMVPSFNLHNKETQAELYVGLLGDDFFDLSLTTFKGKEMDILEISGLNFNQIKEIISLFYSEKFDVIKSFSNKTNNSKSEIKEILVNRYEKQTTEETNNNFKQIGIYLAIGIILYLISRMI